MEQDWKEKFRAELFEDMKKEARQETAEEMARIYLETTYYDDEKISEKFGVPIYKVQKLKSSERSMKNWSLQKH
ncbi:hypothetical protein [Peribacillus acanthi]|uniref:hypothetical protein n=1 Tax=Peribacillus acanthi TaxID=2171554 RepID=UPI000D3E2479|nr:hypothetical protein [Peribacillus acanthi]